MDTYQGHWSVSKAAVNTFPTSPSKYFRCLLLQEVLRIKLTSLTVQGGDADDAEGEAELILASEMSFASQQITAPDY